jgi:phosphodiesterase/alkaline phosphatase D-like protein
MLEERKHANQSLDEGTSPKKSTLGKRENWMMGNRQQSWMNKTNKEKIHTILCE